MNEARAGGRRCLCDARRACCIYFMEFSVGTGVGQTCAMDKNLCVVRQALQRVLIVEIAADNVDACPGKFPRVARKRPHA